MATRKTVTPLDVLRNCRGKVVSVELAGGETVNGTVVRVDRAMNMVLKQCIRTASDGATFWRSRETLLRGASVRNVRMDERALAVPVTEPRTAENKGGRQGVKKNPSGGGKRPRET
ncbi:LSM domain [Trypanosoma vivax]|uniref:U6 snRNA-associated Sm-like protein LSm4 n=1 Tax=Trypanosoma vivax (strain Y486) TaxID=1055687 RepID=G0U8R8_TRYVY|nr:putative small nucleolar ribonucleoprotein-like protein [Trypanosoma vivax]KAH8603381.1 LSM domain [Trypanosoma vivax]CCC53997.1 putative small nucleolar ribonucleoprotein-like protein [Trypanosoma vivax Y486]